MATDLLQTGYRPHLFLYTLDELFFIYNQLKDDDVDACSITMWEILNVAQHHCTEQRGGGKPKGHTLGDAYPHVNLQDLAGLEQLAWAVYDGMSAPGPLPEMLGCHDWDCMLAGTVIPLIYHGKTPYVHYAPCMIAAADVQRATKLARKMGLLSYKERRAHVASSEARAMLPGLLM